jgi:hypothetical protein
LTTDTPVAAPQHPRAKQVQNVSKREKNPIMKKKRKELCWKKPEPWEEMGCFVEYLFFVVHGDLD